jgi:integrase/recombinase XerD
MKPLMEEFLNYLTIERGLSKNTISAYRTDLAHFIEHMATKGIDDVDKVTRQEIMAYLLLLKDRGISSNSISRALVAIKMFYRFLVQERLAKDDVAGVMESPKLVRPLPNVIGLAEVDKCPELDRDTRQGRARADVCHRHACIRARRADDGWAKP